MHFTRCYKTTVFLYISWNWAVWENKRVLLQVYIWPTVCVNEYTVPLFLVDYVSHVLLGKNEPSLNGKAHGPLLTITRWSMCFWTWLIRV